MNNETRAVVSELIKRGSGIQISQQDIPDFLHEIGVIPASVTEESLDTRMREEIMNSLSSYFVSTRWPTAATTERDFSNFIKELHEAAEEQGYTTC